MRTICGSDIDGSMGFVAVFSTIIAVVAPAAHAQSPSEMPAETTVQSPQRKPPEVRERRVVAVDGKSEVWELQWVSPPVPTCRPEGPGWFTCPCDGFAFGESGDLDLVRMRDGKEVDRLSLTPLFADHETPEPAWETKKAVLQRWPVLEKTDLDDWARADSGDPAQLTQFTQRVMRRKPVSVLRVADFNRDGWATEFLLQVGVLPCGKRQSILLGLSPDRPQLHAFGTAERPEIPLVLYPDNWAKLRRATHAFRVVTWPCGDHGSEEQMENTLSVDKAGIHVVRETFSCGAGWEKGKLLSREAP